MTQKIGVLGSGDVAQALAKGFTRHGYEVMAGSRSPEKLTWAPQLGARTGTFAEAAAFGEILVLAVTGRAALDALALAGADRLAGKVVIDATNPIAAEPPENGVLRYFTGPNESLMERLQGRFPEARFVKAFNSVGNEFMVDPKFAGGRPTMFICGDDSEAKAVVSRILDQFGWQAEDMGSVTSARAVEALCQLWCIRGLLRGEWNHAFALFKKEGVSVR